MLDSISSAVSVSTNEMLDSSTSCICNSRSDSLYPEYEYVDNECVIISYSEQFFYVKNPRTLQQSKHSIHLDV